MKWERCKPLPPTITTYLNDDINRPMKEYDFNDEKYKRDLVVWEQDKTLDLNETVVKMGVSTTPPQEFVDVYAVEFPEISLESVKVHWVYSLLAGDEITTFFELLTGQTSITEKGLEEAKATFPSNS